jgi:uncharacterized RDD family membrane protein YckC
LEFLKLISTVITPLIIVVMTMAYIQLRIKKEGLGLEFKLLKMIGKLKNIDMDNVYMKSEVFDIKGHQLEKAGFMSRFVAYSIDFGIGVILALLILSGTLFIAEKYYFDFYKYVVVLISSSFNNFYVAGLFMMIVLKFVFLFNIISEIIMKGQSIGKKIVGIRVVDHNGDSAGVMGIILRNLFRVIDFLPSFFLGGLFVMIFNKREKRIGDIISKTIVIRDNYKKENNVFSETNIWGSNLPHAKNIYPVNNLELEVLKEFISLKELSFERKAFFAYNLNVYFINKFHTKDKYQNPYDFFRDIISMND